MNKTENATKLRFVPMLFSTPMVKAILNGTKTETRRIIIVPKNYIYLGITMDDKFEACFIENYKSKNHSFEKPRVYENDIIWVRETFAFAPLTDETKTHYPELSNYIFKANSQLKNIKWKTSLFMPKTACRIFLKCISSQVERLHQIDEKGAINEGVENLNAEEFKADLYRNYKKIQKENNYQDYYATDCPIYSYETLWENINGKGSWDKNPYVWVYKFEVIERPDEFLLNVNN